MTYTLDAACGCNTGKVRKNNEDNFFFDDCFLDSDNNGLTRPLHFSARLNKKKLLAVFDGMGGENFGELASFAAAECVQALVERDKQSQEIPDDDFLTNLCLKANDAVVAAAHSLLTERMGSTLVGVYFTKEGAYVCNLGDSRAYLLRDGILRQISVDHVEKRDSKRKAPLTQHLGIDPEEYLVEPAVKRFDVCAGDCFLICSDGITDMLSDDEILELLSRSSSTVENVDTLVSAALENGGRDNITCIVCRIR